MISRKYVVFGLALTAVAFAAERTLQEYEKIFGTTPVKFTRPKSPVNGETLTPRTGTLPATPMEHPTLKQIVEPDPKNITASEQAACVRKQMDGVIDFLDQNPSYKDRSFYGQLRFGILDHRDAGVQKGLAVAERRAAKLVQSTAYSSPGFSIGAFVGGSFTTSTETDNNPDSDLDDPINAPHSKQSQEAIANATRAHGAAHEIALQSLRKAMLFDEPAVQSNARDHAWIPPQMEALAGTTIPKAGVGIRSGISPSLELQRFYSEHRGISDADQMAFDQTEINETENELLVESSQERRASLERVLKSLKLNMSRPRRPGGSQVSESLLHAEAQPQLKSALAGAEVSFLDAALIQSRMISILHAGEVEFGNEAALLPSNLDSLLTEISKIAQASGARETFLRAEIDGKGQCSTLGNDELKSLFEAAVKNDEAIKTALSPGPNGQGSPILRSIARVSVDQVKRIRAASSYFYDDDGDKSATPPASTAR